MNKTNWKPIEEIAYILAPYKTLTIISCSLCANLSGTGGDLGIMIMNRHLEKLSKKVIKSDCVLACCEENIMRQTMTRYRKAIAESDALMVLSCAAGVKAAFLCDPKIPVISPLDPVGSVAVTQMNNPIANSPCVMCGSCIIMYTGGICPICACPAKSKYRPCINAPESGIKCVVNTDRICVWQEIKKQGDMDNLRKFGELQKKMTRKMPYEGKYIESPPPEFLHSILPIIRRCLGWFGVRSRIIAKIIAIFR